MSDSLTNDIRQEANTALLEVDKGLYQNNLIGYKYTVCFVKVPECMLLCGHMATLVEQRIIRISLILLIFSSFFRSKVCSSWRSV